MNPAFRAALGLAVAVALASCKPVEVIDAPDTGEQFHYCSPVPIAFCEAGAPGPEACSGDPSAKSPVVKALPSDAGYSVGCVANFIVHTPDNDCKIGATCKCIEAPDAESGASKVTWSCYP